jgi:DNA repair protein RadC
MHSSSSYPHPSAQPSARAAEPEATWTQFFTCSACGHQTNLDTVGQRWSIRSPRDVGDRLLLRYGRLERESLIVLDLNTRLTVIGETELYRGNVGSSLVRIGELFMSAIRNTAACILIAHNHPSSSTGDEPPIPSPDDLHLTAEAIAAGRLLDIPVTDHLILGRSSWVSLRDRGIAFDQTRLPSAANQETRL